MVASRCLSTVEKCLFAAFLLTLFWAPLPFGSNRPWAASLLFVLLSAILSGWLLLFLFDAVSPSRRAWQRSRWPLLALASIPLWIFMQTLPLPPEWVALLSPRAAELHVDSDWVPLSLDVAATKFYLLGSLACFCAFALVVFLVNSAFRARMLLWVLVASGVFQATYGALMVLSGLELGFFVEKYVGVGQATGTFVNRNHLAGYLVITLAAGSGLLLSEFASDSALSVRDFVRKTLQTLLSAKVILRVMLALMVIALVLTRSRMGNMAFFSALAVAGLVALVCGRRFSPKLVLLLLSLFVVDAIIVGQWFGLEKLVERLETTETAGKIRLDVSTSSSSIIEDFPLAGSGGGSYYGIFPYYQDLSTAGSYYTHAHNDYVELISDLGMPVTVLSFGALFLLVLRRALRIQARDHSRLQRGVGFATIMALTWVAMHSWVDFNLQILANGVTLSAVLGLAFAKILPGNGGDNGNKTPV